MHTTTNINDGYFGSGKILRRSINKHGIEHHKKEILQFFPTREDLIEGEKNVVTEDFLKDPLTMNIRLGGEGGGGWTSDQQKQNNKKSQQRQNQLKQNIEWKQHKADKLSKANLEGYRNGTRKSHTVPHKVGEFKHTAEAKQKIGKANSCLTGERNSQYGTRWIFCESDQLAIKVSKELLDEYLHKGWRLGRK